MGTITKELIDAAQAAQRKWKVWASVTLAQYGIESGWGRYEPPGSNNSFGIQALPGLPKVAAQSFEYKHGVRVPETEWFAVFKSVADAFDKHGELIATNKAYAKAMATTNANDFVEALGPVYATAPNYATVILGLMRADNLEEYDKLPAVMGATGPTGAPPMGAIGANGPTGRYDPLGPICSTGPYMDPHPVVYVGNSPSGPVRLHEPKIHPSLMSEIEATLLKWLKPR